MQRLRDKGDANKPIWATEMGWNSAKGESAADNCPAISGVLVSEAAQALYVTNGFNVLFQYTPWDSPPTLPAVVKVFWYQYRDTGVNIDCKNGAAANVAPSWNDSYVAQYVFASALNTETHWWYGLYTGTDPLKGIFEPQPKDAQCTYRLYPAQNALRTCLGLTHDLFLPTVQNGSITATAEQ